MNTKSATEFANWLAQVHPEIFATLAKRAFVVKQPTAKLGDLTDVLSSIGTDLSGAVSGVGNFLSNSSNVNALATAASSYFNAQASGNTQNAVMQTQLARAQAGLSPAPINYTTNASGQLVPINTMTGVPFSASAVQSFMPTFLQSYGMWLAIGGAGLALFFILRR